MSTSESCLSATRTTFPATLYKPLFANLGTLYCRMFHSAISRPVHGRYRCWKCLREFDMGW